MATKRRVKNQKNRKRILFKISLLIFSVYIIYSMISLQARLAGQRQVLRERQEEISALSVSNEELQALLDGGATADFIEQAAREKLDFVFANEEIFQDIRGN